MSKRCGGGEKASLSASDTASKLQCREQVNVKKMRWGGKASLNASDTVSKLQCME